MRMERSGGVKGICRQLCLLFQGLRIRERLGSPPACPQKANGLSCSLPFRFDSSCDSANGKPTNDAASHCPASRVVHLAMQGSTRSL